MSQRQQRQQSLHVQPRERRPRKNRRTLVIVAIAIIIAAIFAWFSVQNNQFVSKLQQSKATLAKTVAEAPAKVKSAKDAGDTAATVAALRDISATVSQNEKSLPTAPAILGLHLGADAERKNRDELQKWAQAYAEGTYDLADFIAYQSMVSRQLQTLSLKDASGYEQTINLATAWQDAREKVKNEAKPARVTDVSATLMQKMESIENIIRDMAESYKKDDLDSFKAKKVQLAAAIEDFKPIGAQITAIGTQLDSELANAAAKLKQNL